MPQAAESPRGGAARENGRAFRRRLACAAVALALLSGSLFAGDAAHLASSGALPGGGALGGGAPGGGRKGHDARIAEHWYFWALNRAVFVHPPKTGGTSLEALLYSAPMLG